MCIHTPEPRARRLRAAPFVIPQQLRVGGVHGGLNLVLSLDFDGPELRLPHEPLAQAPAAVGGHHRDVHAVHARRVHDRRGEPHDAPVLRAPILLILRVVLVLVAEQEPGDRLLVVGEGDAVEELVVGLIVAFRALLREAERVCATNARSVRPHRHVVAHANPHCAREFSQRLGKCRARTRISILGGTASPRAPKCRHVAPRFIRAAARGEEDGDGTFTADTSRRSGR